MKLHACSSDWRRQAISAALLCLASLFSVLAQPASPPAISIIPAQGGFPNATSRPIAFVVGDAETSANLLSLSGVSANQTLVPDGGIVFGGAGSNRTATITPALNQTGATTITITVTDANGGAASNSFVFDVAYFTPVVSGLPQLTYGQAAWGDFDNDGDLDLLISGSDTNSAVARVYRNDSGVFSDINAGLLGAERSQPGWADYDNDGFLDVLITGGSTHLYHNNGDGTFTEVSTGIPPISYATFSWGDMDNDGDRDLLLVGATNYPYSTCQVWRNDGAGNFSNLNLPLPGAYFSSADWGDYDNDGDLDLLMSGFTAENSPNVPITKFYRNDGETIFTEVAAGLPAVYGSTVTWGDYDNDGDLDIYLSGRDPNGNSIARIYRNAGGTFTDISAGLSGGWVYRTTWADFDNDGFLDLVSGGRDAPTRLYRNNRNQTFSQVEVTLANVYEGVATWGDYDNDGDLDLLLIGNTCFLGCPMVQLYRSNGTTNALPSSPVGLTVALQPGNEVLLRWAAATDSQTSSNGLTYNLRVGTNSGGIEINPPQSDLATGYRRVPQPGPAHTNRWRLVDPPKGTYYWAVQAVDTSYAGSLLSTQAAFTITNSRPVIGTIPTQVTLPNVAVSNVNFIIGDAETAATALVVTRSSGSPDLLPEANILLGGSGANRTVTLIPAGNRSGESVVSLTVTDAGGLTRRTNFTLRVEGFTALPPIGPPPLSTDHFIYDFAWLPAVDYDNDGDLDIPFKRLSQLTNSIYETFFLRNDGGNAFTPVEVGLTNTYINSVAWGDVDNDGWLDALIIGSSQVTNNSFSFTRLYRNTGGGFELMSVSLPRFYNGVASIADVSGDGLADLFLSGAKDENRYPHATVILLNDGSGGFAEWKTDLPVISAARVFWVDMDNDGDLDLLSEIQYSTRIFRNDQNGKFTEITTGLGAMVNVTAGNPMDVDNDGLTDVFMSGYYAGVVKRNQGDGTFSTWSVGLTNLTYGSAAVTADYDNDGWADIHMPVQGDNSRLFHNNGNLTFNLVDTNGPAGWCADLDGDGDLDVLANGILWRNNSAVTNTPPAAPANLAASSLPGDAVQLTWNRSTDAQTTNATGLYYNLRIGTTPGGVEVLSPLADLATGHRRVAGLGNASQSNRWVPRDLPRGTYYWSVQALDPAFAGSPFSTNGTFAVTRPQISEIADQQTVPGFPLAIPFTISDVETPANSLVLSATSANTNLVPLANIVFSGSGTNRTVTLSPTPGLTGTNTISITVTDGNGFTDSTTFTLIVMPFLPLGNLTIDKWDNVFPADYNNDGLMDVLVSSDQVILWRNLGNGQFTNDATGLPMWHYGPGAWGDFDNDGWLDLALANLGRVYRNTGTNHFIVVTNGLFSDGNCCYKNVAWGDYDGDGWLDLVRVGDSASSTALLRNLGNGTFTNSGFAPAWGYTPALGWADLDNDGKPELLVSASKTFSDYNYDFTYIYRYNGGTNFTLVSSNALLTARFPTVGFRDFDADGDLDILIAGERSTGATCRVHRNDGNFNFTSLGNLTPNAGRNAAWGDYNNDGRPDILSYASQPSTVFVNLGNGSFTNIQANLNTVELFNGAWADFDNDGDLDVLSGKLYANLVPVSNQPPQAPSGLMANIISNRLVLSWNAPVDDTTGSKAFTYAVRLGTNSCSSQFLAADADPATGFRRAVPDVSAWPNRWRTVENVPDGMYFWSVQAIDSGYAGSPFAAEASFSYFHPTISGPSNVVVSPAAPVALVFFTVGDADSPAASLTMSAFTSNPNLLIPTNIVFGGSDSNRTATITLPPGAMGDSLVHIVVTDNTGLMTTNTFRFESSYFSEVMPVFSGSNYFNAHWADMDNDNDLDVFYGGFIYRNDGPTNFALVAAPGAANRNGVVWGDYDRDGDQDFAHADGATLRIFRNAGGGTFINPGPNFALGGTAGLAWGDYDHDGDLDLAVTQPGASRIYRNDGGAFTLLSTSLPPCQDGAVAWGDFDNDGDLDLLLAGLGSYSTDWRAEIFRNDGAGVFTALSAGLFGTDHSSVAWGDIDNDGWLDALVTGFNFGSYVLKLYHNNGNGTFTDINVGLQGVAFADAGFGDFDNDGWTDIHLNGCIVNYCDLVINSIYRNNRDGTFSDLNAGLAPTTAGQVGVGDYDNDGDLDLLAHRLYQNNNVVSNTPPSTPLAPGAQLLPDNAVLLTWQSSSDLETTNTAGLSYDIRVGTTPGGVEYISPSADPASGYRRVPQRGSLNSNACLLRDVPKGTFYWSAQAIDPTFAGSPFSVEGSFTITNARPLISAISNQVTVPGRTTPPLNFTVSDFETDATNLEVTGYSTNPAIVPNGNIVFGGAGSNRTVTLTTMSGVSGTTTIIIGVTDGGGLIATSRFDVVVQTFTEVSVGLPVSTTIATAWGDYDNDGDLDIATAGPQYGNTAVYRNTNGAFTNQNFTLPATGYYLTPTDLAWLDFDNDGDLDLAESGWLSYSSGYTPATLRLRNNYPVNSFTSISTNLPGTGVTNIADGAMAWGDYDNDGDLDAVLSGDPNTYHSPDAFTALYRSDRGVFTNSGVALPALVRGAAVWGDYDHDGDLDLLLAGQTGSVATNSVAKLFRNDGAGGFTETATPFPGVTDCALAFGDMDNDGDLDLALAGTGMNAAPLTRIYRNTGNGGFTNLTADLKNVTYASVSWGDFDNDGFADLVVSGATNPVPYYNAATVTTTIYRNYGGAGFTNIGGALPGVMMQNTSWGDADNDGDLDLLVGPRVVRNNWNLPNTPPGAPTNLSFVLLANNDVRLSWAPATDVETTNSHGLSYNLRLGTNSGGGQIMVPLANGTNGYHRVPNFGNAGPTNFWRLANLTNGTYYWSVQAIDSGLAGSGFAAEQTFTLSRPVFSVITNRSVFPNTFVAPINFSVSDGETAASNLVVTASSSDPNLVANANLVVNGTGTSRSLLITPAANRSGRVTITLTAVDESGQVGGTSFVLVVERFADIAAGLSPVVGAVAWGDYDNDGNLDLARGSTIYRNTGLGTFVNLPLPNFPTPFYQHVAWGDYDNDIDLDLMFGNYIYRNEGAGNFVNLPGNLNAPALGLPAWGDSDNDGDLDLIYPYGNGTYLYRNNGNNTFSNLNSGLPYLSQGSVAWGDFDKDGDLDVLAAGNNALRVYRNNGNNGFTEVTPALPGLYTPSVAWGDFDNDGDLDFAAIGSTNNSFSGVVTRIYRNTTNSNPNLPVFSNLYPVAAQGPVGVWKGAVAWGDYDNDGDFDLLTTGETTNILARTRIYRNDSGNFVDSGDALPALKNSFAAWGDFNNDGSLDLALSGNENGGPAVARIYRNYANGVTNVPPNSPGSLTNIAFGKSIRLSWAAATDANQAAGLSYNLRLGTTPGGGEVVGPMAGAAGLRQVAALGNANERLMWTITNLTGGTYYWSVQAVDHSLAGSAFASEGSFVISNRLPLAVAQNIATTEDTSKALTLTGSDPDADPLTFNIATPPLFGQLTGTPPNVTYRPATNYAGFDQFAFRAHDRTTNSVPAIVFITVTPVADVAASSLSLAPLGSGQYQLSLLAEPWRSYRLEASEDLIHWQPLTNLLATNLLTLLVDADAPNFPQRFYRAAQFSFAPELGAAQLGSNSQFQFTLTGEPGRNYQVQVSPNLVTWTPLTNVFMTNAVRPFADGDAVKFPSRFYRLVAP